jgi:Transglutaminase-like superfamily
VGNLGKFARLPPTDRSLLIYSALLLAGVRLGLWLLPFRSLHRLLVKFNRDRHDSQGVEPATIDRVSWAVTVASRYIPSATCLTQALATKVLLCRRGQASVLRIGVTRSTGGEFLAHAWIECNGNVVIGGPDEMIERYKSLPPLGEDLL